MRGGSLESQIYPVYRSCDLLGFDTRYVLLVMLGRGRVF